MDRLPDVPEGAPIDFTDESIPLHVRRNEAMRMMLKAERLAKERGITYAAAEAHYYSVKAWETDELYDKGTPATVIAQKIKGMPETNKALKERIAEEIGYKNSVDAVQCYKLIVRILEADIEREWQQAQRM